MSGPVDSWRFVCDLPCDAPMKREADHRVVDGDAMHRLRIPYRGARPVVLYARPGAPEKLMVSGGVIGGIGATAVVVGYVVLVATSLRYIDPSPDEPPPTNPAEAPAKAAMIGGGVTFLLGGVLALSGVIARRARSPRTSLATPLGFRF